MTQLNIPRPTRSVGFEMPDRTRICVRQHGDPTGPRLLFSHGNGLAIDGYFPFWRLFLGHFDVLVYDQRNHGQNPLSDTAGHQLANFTKDLNHLLDLIQREFGMKPITGIFHSLSAMVSLKHATDHSWPWKALVLFDPPFAVPAGHQLHQLTKEGGQTLSDRAAQRQSRFKAPEELAEKFRRANQTVQWVPGAHELLARSVLRTARDGDFWELSCPREYEARIFAENSDFNLTPLLATLGGPTLFLCADPYLPEAHPPAVVNNALHRTYNHRYQYVPGTTHMLQLERPEHCAHVIIAFLKEAGAK